MSSPTSKDPLLGTLIEDRYVITEVLGRGGMGVVYGGVHERLQRNVAIKVLAAAFSTDTVAAQRFLREARIASNLSHGNIVDVSDLGQLPDGRPYLVMPRVEGRDFAELLVKEGPFSPERVVELLRGAASALDLVHAKGLLHRDVKPENLMHVIREDGSETVMLLDFGIATLLGPEVARLTAEGRIVGTPAYLSPELVTGEETDRRGDIYALATVAFELMTGRLPYVSDNPLKLLPLKAQFDAPRMSLVSGQEFPEAVERVIARGLARSPHERHATAGELISELAAAVRGSAAPTVLAVQTPLPPPPARADRRSPLPSRELSLEDAGDVPTELRERGERGESADALLRRTSLSVESSATLPRAPARGRLLWGGLGLLAVVGLAFALGRSSEPNVVVPPRVPTVVPIRSGAPQPAASAPAAAEAKPATPTAEAAPAAPEARTAVPAAPARDKRPRTPVARPQQPPPSQPAPTLIATPRPAEPTAEELNRQAASELMQGHLARAADLYHRATERDPRNAGSWRGLALSSERLGKRDAAVSAYKRALRLTPAGPQADSLRTRLEQLQGQ